MTDDGTLPTRERLTELAGLLRSMRGSMAMEARVFYGHEVWLQTLDLVSDKLEALAAVERPAPPHGFGDLVGAIDDCLVTKIAGGVVQPGSYVLVSRPLMSRIRAALPAKALTEPEAPHE